MKWNEGAAKAAFDSGHAFLLELFFKLRFGPAFRLTRWGLQTCSALCRLNFKIILALGLMEPPYWWGDAIGSLNGDTVNPASVIVKQCFHKAGRSLTSEDRYRIFSIRLKHYSAFVHFSVYVSQSFCFILTEQEWIISLSYFLHVRIIAADINCRVSERRKV